MNYVLFKGKVFDLKVGVNHVKSISGSGLFVGRATILRLLYQIGGLIHFKCGVIGSLFF